MAGYSSVTEPQCFKKRLLDVMKFWQCLVIALFFHMAIMIVPIKMTTDIRVGDVRWIVTEKVDTSLISAAVPKEVPPEIKKPDHIAKIRPRPVEKPPETEPVQEKTPEMPRIQKPVLVEPKLEEIVVHHPEPAEEFVVFGPEILQTSEEQAPLRMSFDSSEGPKFLKQVLPLYPRRAKRLHKSGTVVLMLTIDEEGILVGSEVVKGAGYGLDEESIRAVRQSTFISARRNRKPIACRALLPVRFDLR